jgi:hypothetical protein
MEKVCGTGGGCCISATTLLAARRSWLHARLQVANRACCSEGTTCTRSGWRKPAVEEEACWWMEDASLRRHSGMQGGAAGVSQPWLASRVCKSETATRRLRRPVASTKRRCKCVTEPRRADARRSWLHARLPIASCAFASDAVVEMRLVAVVMAWIVVPRNGAPRVRDAVHPEGCGNGVGRDAAK